MKLSKGQLWALFIMLFVGGVTIGLGLGREFQPEPALVEVPHTDTIVQFVEYEVYPDASVIDLKWQYFLTDTVADRVITPVGNYDDVILIRRFYYRGGPR